LKLLTDYQKLIVNRSLLEYGNNDWIARIENGKLTSSEINLVIDALSNEFHIKGIDSNYEATLYGKEVEKVIDIVNRIRL
jgi:hypothetical protein